MNEVHNLLHQLLSQIDNFNFLNPNEKEKAEIKNLTNKLLNMPNIDHSKLAIILGGVTALKMLRVDSKLKANLIKHIKSCIKDILDD